MSAPPSFLTASLTSAGWPLSFLGALVADAAAPPPPPNAKTARDTRASPFATLGEHVGMQLGCLPRLLLAVWVISYQLHGWEVYARTLSWSWAARIIARNVLLCWLVGGVTDFLMLSPHSPFRASLAKHKFNPLVPLLFSRNQTGPIARDICWSTLSACIAGALEVGLLHAYATGAVAYHSGSWFKHAPSLALMLSWPYTQNIQFYALHRCLHPWGTTSVPDVGAWLYKHVHSLHHVARNPTAFSGIAMHPVESVLYLSYAFFPVLFGAHPIVPIYIWLNLIAAAMLGHTGHEWPGGGSFPHFLHHSLVQVNFAETHLPLDWLLGTWAGDEEDAQKSLARRGFRSEPEGGSSKAAAGGGSRSD